MAKAPKSAQVEEPLDLFPDMAPGWRNVSNDNEFKNLYVGMYNVQKSPTDNVLLPRPAFDLDPGNGGSSGRKTVFGGYYWPATGKWYTVEYNGTTYYIAIASTSAATPVSAQTIATVTELKVGFAEWNYEGNHYLIVSTGAEVWYINTSDVITQITDPDLPAPHIPTPIVFDGYLFLAAKNTQFIYNSLPLDLTTWQATTRIAAERSPGTVRALALVDNKLLAFKSDLIEEFYDAGIAAPNSPLVRTNKFWEYNIINYKMLCQEGDKLWWVGDAGKAADHNVLQMEGGQVTNLTTAGLYRFISESTAGASIFTGTAVMYTIWDLGRPFVVLGTGVLNSVGSDLNLPDWTPVYDTASKKWMFWSTAKINGSNNQSAGLPFVGTSRTAADFGFSTGIQPTVLFCRTYYSGGASPQPHGFTITSARRQADAYLAFSTIYSRWMSGVILDPFKDKSFGAKLVHSMQFFTYSKIDTSTNIKLDITETTPSDDSFGPRPFTELSLSTGIQNFRFGPLGRAYSPIYTLSWGAWSNTLANIGIFYIRQGTIRYSPCGVSA